MDEIKVKTVDQWCDYWYSRECETVRELVEMLCKERDDAFAELKKPIPQMFVRRPDETAQDFEDRVFGPFVPDEIKP